MRSSAARSTQHRAALHLTDMRNLTVGLNPTSQYTRFVQMVACSSTAVGAERRRGRLGARVPNPASHTAPPGSSRAP